MTAKEQFTKFARGTARAMGSPITFGISVLVIIAWGVTGPRFHYSDTWQLVINTGTSVITFLMVFVIQSTQNRDATAMHLKLNELIRAMQGARNRMVTLEELTQDELAELKAQFTALAERSHRGRGAGVAPGEAVSAGARGSQAAERMSAVSVDHYLGETNAIPEPQP